MTQEKETTASLSIHEFTQVCKGVDLDIESEFAGIFAQKRTYEKAADYISALSDPLVPVKSAWDAAEYSWYDTPGPFQSLVGENKWSHAEAWDRIAVTAGKLAEADVENDPLGAGILFDETADIKRGKMTCGVGCQYAGCAGGVVNCVTWVIASLTGTRIKTWVAAGLFLPEKDWFTGNGNTGTERRTRAGIPGEIQFASKPEIALGQLRNIRGLGVRFSYGSGDEVYGRYGKLREDHEKNGEAYAYFVPRDHVVKTLGGEYRRVDELLELEEAVFETRSAGSGIKGPRDYEWAMIGIQSEDHFLLLRRPVREEKEERELPPGSGTCGDPASGSGELPEKNDVNASADRVKDEGITFCLCYVPPRSSVRPTLTNLILMAGKRWGIEETIATGKGPLGWDENQFRRWESMNHHTALAGIAMLRATMIQQRLTEIETGITRAPETAAEDSEPGSGISIPGPREPAAEFGYDDLRIPIGDSEVPAYAGQEIPPGIGFIRLSRNEVMRLTAIVKSDMSEARKAFHLRWSKWRRKHQAISRWYHRMARIKAEQESCAGSAFEEVTTQGDLHFRWPADVEAEAA